MAEMTNEYDNRCPELPSFLKIYHMLGLLCGIMIWCIMIIIWLYDDPHMRIWWWCHIARTISLQKIYGLHGLKHHMVEISGDGDDEQRKTGLLSLWMPDGWVLQLLTSPFCQICIWWLILSLRTQKLKIDWYGFNHVSTSKPVQCSQYIYKDMLFLFHISSIYDIWTSQVPTPLDCDFPPYYAKVLFSQQCHLLHKSCIPCNQTLSSTHFHISGATAISLVISLFVLPDLIQLFRTVDYITLCETIQGQS